MHIFDDFAKQILDGLDNQEAEVQFWNGRAKAMVITFPHMWRSMHVELGFSFSTADDLFPSLPFCVAVARSHPRFYLLRQFCVELPGINQAAGKAAEQYDYLSSNAKFVANSLNLDLSGVSSAQPSIDNALLASHVLIHYVRSAHAMSKRIEERIIKPLVATIGDENAFTAVSAFWEDRVQGISQAGSAELSLAMTDNLIEGDTGIVVEF